MKHSHISILLLTLFIAITWQSHAQKSGILKPIKWSSEISVAEAKVGDVVELIFKAKIDKDWYLYSSDCNPDLGPIITTFQFENHASYELIDTLIPINPSKKHDNVWDGEISYFKKEAVFKQKIRILSTDLQVKATMGGQVCTDVNGRCIPIEEDFVFDNSNIKIEAGDKKKVEAKPDDNEKINPEKILETDTANKIGLDTSKKTEIDLEKKEAEPSKFTTSSAYGDLSLGMFLLITFLAGLAAIFTPCVFPMIPLTVSMFTGKDKGIGHALFYGFSIIAIYTLLGVLTVVAGATILNELSTHWATNFLFFSVFILFAISFFGMFDIQLPSSFVNKMDEEADKKGGFLGVFFMAFTLTLVSFSCTGPIVGTLLVASAGGELLRPILGMAVFGSAFAFPFIFFALFPKAMDKLPQSGGWLNTVKVTLGFIELALAFKFLSMIDLVYHLGILDRDMNIAIWIAIFSFMGLYYLGKIRLPHDSPEETVSVPKMMIALACFTFVIYMIPGMFGAPLKALSGLLPSTTSHDFDLREVVRNNSVSGDFTVPQSGEREKIKYSDFLKLPHGFKGYFDYKQGMEVAKKLGKPVLLDFTGHGCANCRKMEDNVWVESPVREQLMNDWVIISLYVDDRTELPESEWVTSTFDGKIKKTIGAINMDFEISKFDNNAQPLYILVDSNGELLANAKAYDPDVQSFSKFLDDGLSEFKKKTQK